MADIKIYLSAGHGGKDPGAVALGKREADLTVQVRNAVKKELTARGGYAVKCDHATAATDAGYTAETKEAKSWGAKLYLDMHFNAGGGAGTECYYQSDAEKKIAALLASHISKKIGLTNRGAKSRPKGKEFLANTLFEPGVLLECAFIDSKADMAKLDTAKELECFACAVADALDEYFGIKRKADAIKPAAAATSVPTKPVAAATAKPAAAATSKPVAPAASTSKVTITAKIATPPAPKVPKVGDKVKIIKSYAVASTSAVAVNSRLIGSVAYVVREVKGARYPLLLAGKPQDEAAYWIGWAQPGGVQVV
jgi:N-acetylmuramoyl-L-alanine amidase